MTSIQDRIEQKTIEVSSGVKDRYILLQWVGNHLEQVIHLQFDMHLW